MKKLIPIIFLSISLAHVVSAQILGTKNAVPLVIATTNTTSPQPIEFFTNNLERARFDPTGRFGIGTTVPTSPFCVQAPVTAVSASGIGSCFIQTITAAANNDALYGIDVAPTFVNGAFTGLTNYAIRGLYAGTLTNGAAIRGKSTGNGGANGEVIGVWGTASDSTQGASTNAGVGVKAEGNNTFTDAKANIALQVVGGEFVVGRQAASAVNVNVSGSNILAEDDANALTDQGPSGVVDVTGGGLPAANSVTTGTLQVWSRYVKSNSIILLTGLNGGTGVLSANESVDLRVTARSSGTFTIEVRRVNPAVAASTGTAGTWRVGFLVVNPGK